MFCPKCGMNNNDENLWCIKCGIRLEQTVSQEEPLTIDVEPVSESTAETLTYKDEAEAPIDTKPETVYVIPEVKEEKERLVKDHLIWSILAAIFGSIIFGTVAVIFSGLVQTERSTGDMEKAERYSSRAKLFCIIATSIGVAKAIFVVLLLVLISRVVFLPFF